MTKQEMIIFNKDVCISHGIFSCYTYHETHISDYVSFSAFVCQAPPI